MQGIPLPILGEGEVVIQERLRLSLTLRHIYSFKGRGGRIIFGGAKPLQYSLDKHLVLEQIGVGFLNTGG